MPVNDSNLTDTQEKILSLLPIIPSLLSVAGSTTILCSVIRTRVGSPHKRFLFGMSVSDIIGSLSFLFQAFLVPRDSSYRVWAIGNDATCTLVGATTQLGFGTAFYNLSISIWYVASIRYGVPATSFSKYVEPWLHFVSIGFPVCTTISGVILGVFHEYDIDLGCWVSDYPEGCDLDPNDDIPCKSITIGWIFAGYPYIVAFIIILINKILIVMHVCMVTRQIPGSTVFSTTTPEALETTTTDSKREGRLGSIAARLRRVRRQSNVRNQNIPTSAQINRARSVAVQSLYYVGAFFFTFMPGGMLRVLETQNVGLATEPGELNDEQQIFPLLIVNRILFPSVGLLNVFVFLRPQYNRVRARHRGLSRFAAFRKALQDSMDVEKLAAGRGRGRGYYYGAASTSGRSSFFTTLSSRWPGMEPSAERARTQQSVMTPRSRRMTPTRQPNTSHQQQDDSITHKHCKEFSFGSRSDDSDDSNNEIYPDGEETTISLQGRTSHKISSTDSFESQRRDSSMYENSKQVPSVSSNISICTSNGTVLDETGDKEENEAPYAMASSGGMAMRCIHEESQRHDYTNKNSENVDNTDSIKNKNGDANNNIIDNRREIAWTPTASMTINSVQSGQKHATSGDDIGNDNNKDDNDDYSYFSFCEEVIYFEYESDMSEDDSSGEEDEDIVIEG